MYVNIRFHLYIYLTNKIWSWAALFNQFLPNSAPLEFISAAVTFSKNEFCFYFFRKESCMTLNKCFHPRHSGCARPIRQKLTVSDVMAETVQFWDPPSRMRSAHLRWPMKSDALFWCVFWIDRNGCARLKFGIRYVFPQSKLFKAALLAPCDEEEVSICHIFEFIQ